MSVYFRAKKSSNFRVWFWSFFGWTYQWHRFVKFEIDGTKIILDLTVWNKGSCEETSELFEKVADSLLLDGFHPNNRIVI